MPPDTGKQYLFTQIKSAFMDEGFQPTYLPTKKVSDDDPTPIWHQALRASESRGFSINPQELFYSDYPLFVYDLRDTIDLLPGTVDSVSYEVLKSLFFDLNSQKNPFEFNGNSIKTNIEGGIGRWTGIGINGSLSVLGDK